jgi:hypothetical protein
MVDNSARNREKNGQKKKKKKMQTGQSSSFIEEKFQQALIFLSIILILDHERCEQMHNFWHFLISSLFPSLFFNKDSAMAQNS